jgi:hypothetical protein
MGSPLVAVTLIAEIMICALRLLCGEPLWHFSAVLAIVAILAISSYAAALFSQPCRFALCAGLMDATWM